MLIRRLVLLLPVAALAPLVIQLEARPTHGPVALPVRSADVAAPETAVPPVPRARAEEAPASPPAADAQLQRSALPAPVFTALTREALPSDLDTSVAREIFRQRHVEARADLSGAEILEWNLFEDERLVVRRRSLTWLAENGSEYTWRGRVEGDPHSEVVALVRHGRLTASIALSTGAVFSIDTVRPGIQVVREVNEAALPDCGSEAHSVALAEPAAASDADSGAAPPPAAAAASEAETIDVLMLYTTRAANEFGSATGLEDRLALLVEWSNVLYENTGVPQRLRAAGFRQVGYDDSHRDGRTALDHVTFEGDGELEEVPGLRDQYGADMVSLFTGATNVCGIAWVPNSAAQIGWYEPYMFSVVSRACLGTGRTFAHELGHNQGAYHDPATSLLQGMTQAEIDAVPSPNSFGYIGPGDGFHTTMAYGSTCGGCTWVQQFSTPLLDHQGQATGDARSEVRVTLDATETTIAGFRDAVTCGGGSDGDGDGVCDSVDNCLDEPNLTQDDSDLDGYGNACDTDYTNDGIVGVPDFSVFQPKFGLTQADPGYDGVFDHVADGIIGVPDYSVLLSKFGANPGPSALACAGTTPCP